MGSSELIPTASARETSSPHCTESQSGHVSCPGSPARKELGWDWNPRTVPCGSCLTGSRRLLGAEGGFGSTSALSRRVSLETPAPVAPPAPFLRRESSRETSSAEPALWHRQWELAPPDFQVTQHPQLRLQSQQMKQEPSTHTSCFPTESRIRPHPAAGRGSKAWRPLGMVEGAAGFPRTLASVPASSGCHHPCCVAQRPRGLVRCLVVLGLCPGHSVIRQPLVLACLVPSLGAAAGTVVPEHSQAWNRGVAHSGSRAAMRGTGAGQGRAGRPPLCLEAWDAWGECLMRERRPGGREAVFTLPSRNSRHGAPVMHRNASDWEVPAQGASCSQGPCCCVTAGRRQRAGEGLGTGGKGPEFTHPWGHTQPSPPKHLLQVPLLDPVLLRIQFRPRELGAHDQTVAGGVWVEGPVPAGSLGSVWVQHHRAGAVGP